MLSLDECRAIIQAYINELNKSADPRVGLVDWYKEGEFCFAFTTQSESYVKTGNMKRMLAGAGHTLVDRWSGELVFMANNGTMENYEKRGDPYNGLSSLLSISDCHKDGLRQDSIKYLREVTGLSIAKCRDIIEDISHGICFVFDTKMWREQEISLLMEGFSKLGYNVRRLTDFEARSQTTSDS